MNKHRFIDAFPRVFHEKFYVSANFQSKKHSSASLIFCSDKFFIYKYGLLKPSAFIPVFISGQLMNKFHNKPVR